MMKKRILALGMAVLMFGSFCSIYAEDADATADNTASLEENVIVKIDSPEFDALYAMGFLDDEIKSASKDDFITRAQFTGYLCKIAGINVGELSTDNIPFIDVNIKTPYYKEICAMYSMGIISGTSANTFSPSSQVLYAQATQMIIKVLGYIEYAETKYGTYPDGAFKTALELDISDSIKKDKNTAITLEDAIVLLYNTGMTEMLNIIGVDSKGNVTYNTNGNTLFETGNDIYFSKGVMQCDAEASILSADVTDGYMIISGRQYIKADMDLSHLLGCKVRFFYKDNQNIKKILWAYEDSSSTSITIKAADLLVNDGQYSFTNIKYSTGTNRTRSLRVSNSAKVIYNKTLCSFPDADTIRPKTGTLRVADSNGDGTYDVIIVDEFYNIFVSYIKEAAKEIGDVYNRNINIEKYDVIKIFRDGKEIEFKDVESNTLLSCFENKDKTKIYIYVADGKGQGKLTMIKTEDRYIFDNTEYKLSKDYINLLSNPNLVIESPKLSNEYTYYLDLSGEIGAIVSGKEKLQYALLMRYAEEDELFGTSTVNASILLEGGSKTITKTKKKLRVDTGSGISSYTSAEFAAYLSGKSMPQVVKVAFDSEGYLNEIHFPIDNTDRAVEKYGYNEESFSYDDRITSVRVVDNRTILNHKYMLNEKTRVFVKRDGLNVDDPYEVYGKDIITGNRTMYLYDVNPDMTVSIAYAEGFAAGDYMGGCMLVESVETVINDEGDIVKRIIGICGTEYVDLEEYESGIVPSDLERGDVVRVAKLDGKATVVTKIFDNAEYGTSPYKLLVGSTPDDECNIRYVPVYNISNVGLTTVNPDSWKSTYGELNSTGLRGNMMVVYDRAADEMYVGDIHDIYPRYQPNKDGSFDESKAIKAILWSRYESMMGAIVIIN